MKPQILYTVSSPELEVLSLLDDGTVITRHRREDNVLHVHRQQVPQLPELLAMSDDWVGESLSFEEHLEPPFAPAKLIALRRSGDSRYAFAFPLVSLTDADVAWVHAHFPKLLFLVHDGAITSSLAEAIRPPPTGP